MTADDPAVPGETHPLLRLIEVMDTLRGPGGCPWDRAQSHTSLLPYLIEEAYELIEAVERQSDDALREELGDVLLQVVFHARIARERGAFSIAEVAETLTEKLVARHPHVFAGQTLDTPEAVSRSWHARKMEQRRSALDGVPDALPALLWASQVGARAARSGFEWNHSGEIFAKAAEELAEFQAAVAVRDAPAPEGVEKSGPDHRESHAEMEFGDLLFALVQLARWQGIDPEGALRRSTRKFSDRFRWMERSLGERKPDSREPSPAQWWALWEKAKNSTG